MIWLKRALLFIAWLCALVVFVILLYLGCFYIEFTWGDGRLDAFETQFIASLVLLATLTWTGAMLRPGYRLARWIGFFALGAAFYSFGSEIWGHVIPDLFIFTAVAAIVVVFTLATGQKRSRVIDISYQEVTG